MLDRLEKLPTPEPNVENVLAVMRREKPERVPFLEIKLDDEIQAELLGEPVIYWSKDDSADRRAKSVSQHVGLMHRLGYDAFRIRTPIPFLSSKSRTGDTADLSRGERAWQDENTGPIQSFEDFEQYAWPSQSEVDYSQGEAFAKAMPEGMGCLAYVSGVFEWSSWMMGLTPFMMALYEQPELVQALTDRVGSTILEAMKGYAGAEHVVAFWCGDDMGFKTSTLISPDHLRQYVLPWHKRFAEFAHSEGKPYLLHCCGNIEAIMPDLANDVKIDAIHSFEDVIEPVEQCYEKWHDRTAFIGGVDIDLMTRGTEEQVAQRTRDILEACAPGGGYAAGSGNSVANYIPVNNYLKMIETIHRYNGRM